MKVLYCDCFSGVSGDMLLGALIDAGANKEQLMSELSKLGLSNEYDFSVQRAVKKGISATDVQINLIGHHHHHHDDHHHNEQADHTHGSEHTHWPQHQEPHADTHFHNRNLIDIARIIDNSSLDIEIKAKAKYVFQRLAKAEAKVHGTTIDKVHFHEVGAVDAIVDIVGTVIAMSLLGIKKVISSPLPTGSGFIKCAHGITPVPAPATAELIKNIPIYDPGVKGELVTPTGAALITSLADDYGVLPAMNVLSIGYGAGNKDFGIPNVLRVFVGEFPDKVEPGFKNDFVYVLETTIDDCSPEVLGYLWEKIFGKGALDMYYTPIFMKKGRPANLLTIITSEDNLSAVSKTIFDETSTIGIRVTQTSRFILERETKNVVTSLGSIRYKISGNTIKPEFEDLKQISEKHGLALKEVYLQALTEYKNQ